jgi:hypothetical protein
VTTIAGASRFLAASTLANVRGISPSTPSILGDSGMSILDAAARPDNGIGLSARARQFNANYLSESASSLNKILSLGTSALATNESMQQTILALRASVPQSQLSREIRGESVDTSATGTAADGASGTVIDEEV